MECSKKGFRYQIDITLSKMKFSELGIKKNSSIEMEELFLTLKTTNMKIFVVHNYNVRIIQWFNHVL